MTLDPLVVCDALASVAPPPAPLHEPQFAGNEWAYVKECLDTGWVSTAGAYVERLESQLTAFTGARFAVATVSGTTALQMCLEVSGVRAGEEVVVPALTFVGTANAVAHAGAVPHFADCEVGTLGIDPEKLARHLDETTDIRGGSCVNATTGRAVAALVCVHTYGHAANLDALAAVCARHRLILIEDAAESLGSTYKGRHTGNYGLLSALSFNGNKVVTTGGGGAVLTNDAVLAKRARHLTTTAKQAHPWEFIHDEVGYNFRMPNINAALGCAQMESLPDFLARKRRLAERYRSALADVPGVAFFREPDHGESNYWLNVLLLDRADADQRDTVLAISNERGILTRPAWRPLHRLAMFSDCPRMDLSVAEDIYRRLINLPSSPKLVNPKSQGT